MSPESENWDEMGYTEPVQLSTYIQTCETVEEALGITPLRMRELERITKELIAGKKKVGEALHAIATYPRFTECERTYVTFKITEEIGRLQGRCDEDPDECDEAEDYLLGVGCDE